MMDSDNSPLPRARDQKDHVAHERVRQQEAPGQPGGEGRGLDEVEVAAAEAAAVFTFCSHSGRLQFLLHLGEVDALLGLS